MAIILTEQYVPSTLAVWTTHNVRDWRFPEISIPMRKLISALLVSAVTIGAAACADNAVAPRETASRDALTPTSSFDRINKSIEPMGMQTQSFVIPARGGQVDFGGVFTLDFPAHSVCDPATSGYGDWDAPCPASKSDVHVTATYGVQAGQLLIDFDTPLRFVPTRSRHKWVTLSTNIYHEALIGVTSSNLLPDLLYIPSLGAQPIDESLTDPTLRTHIDLRSGNVWRRIEHFSGYLVGAGDGCTDQNDPTNCVQVDGRM